MAAVLIAAAGGVAWRLLPAGGPDHPSAWDARVADLAAFVERERGHDFRHPVHVDFLADAEFREEVTADAADLSDEDRAEIEAAAGFLRALGLVEGDVDLFSAVNQLYGEGTLAFYDPERERIRVRGTDLSVNLRGTLVHELTHALQDQVFDLSREGDFDVEAQNDTYRTVYEGDAERIEEAWVAELPDPERQAYLQGVTAEGEGVDLEGIPEILIQLFAAPYIFGKPFVELLVTADGQERIDRALEEPPTSEAQLLDPFRYLEGEDPVPVEEPALAEGERRVDGGDFGSLGLYLVLAQRIEPRQALAAVDGWAGDSYVSFERDGRQCARARFAGRDPDATHALGDALGAWVAGMPAGSASLRRGPDTVELNACDPGPVAAVATSGRLADAVAVPLFRTSIATLALEAGVPRDLARCAADRVTDSFTIEELEEMTRTEEGFTSLMQHGFEAGTDCRI